MGLDKPSNILLELRYQKERYIKLEIRVESLLQVRPNRFRLITIPKTRRLLTRIHFMSKKRSEMISFLFRIILDFFRNEISKTMKQTVRNIPNTLVSIGANIEISLFKIILFISSRGSV